MNYYFRRLLPILITVLSLPLYAQQIDFKPDEYWQKNYSSAIANNSTGSYGDMLMETTQDDWGTMTSDPYWENAFTYKSVVNLIKVSIDHDRATIVPYNYKYRIDLKIKGKTSPTANFSEKFVSLVIEYNKDAGEVYNDLSLFKIEGAGFHSFTTQLLDIVDLNEPTPTTVAKADLAKNFYIETKIIVQKYDKGSFNIRTFSKQNTQTPAYIDVWWQSVLGSLPATNCNQTLVPSCGNTIKPVMYEMEWTYIDNYKYNLANGIPDNSGPLTNNPTVINYDFKNNSTRITTNNSCYQIPRIYEKGFIVFRVRSIRPDLNNFSNLIYSPWTLPDNGTIHFNSNNCYWQYAQKLDAYEGDKFNWQYSVSFAEEGKNKGVINYFDGAGYNRQTQTKINSDKDYTIVAEKIYDYEGRPAIQTLPIPVWSKDLKYKNNLSIHKTTGLPYQAGDFDFGCTQDSIAPFKETSLASLYYSPVNSHQEGMQKFVPDAQGYPFIETIYSPDNTNKVVWQGGAGLNMQRWKKHGTRYSYVRAGQNEINKLLGTESGYFEYYPKQVVVDPNSQASFSIFNPAGKVIATALAGTPPADTTYPIQPLSNYSAPSGYTSELLAGLSQQLGGGKRMAEHSFFVEATGANTLQYKSTIPAYNPLCGSEYLKVNAHYSVKVLNECGTLEAVQESVIGDGNVISASNESYNFTGNTFSTPSLPPDKYTIVKELYFPDTAMQRLAIDFVNEHIGYSDCYLTQDSFVRIAVEAETFPCVTTETPTSCEMRKRKMMDELYPGAKYGLYVKNGNGLFGGEVTGNSIFTSVNTACNTVSGNNGLVVGSSFVDVINGIPFQIHESADELFLAEYVLQDLSVITFSDTLINAGAKHKISFTTTIPQSQVKNLDSLILAPRNNPDETFADGLYLLTHVNKLTNVHLGTPNGINGGVIIDGPIDYPIGGTTNTSCTYEVHYSYSQLVEIEDHEPSDYGFWVPYEQQEDNQFMNIHCEYVDTVTVADPSLIPAHHSGTCNGHTYNLNMMSYVLLWCDDNNVIPDTSFYRYQSPCITSDYTILVSGTPNENGLIPVSNLHIHQLTPDQLIQYFNDNIAEALLPLHPEYCKLLMCETGDFETKLENTDSFQEAVALGISTLSGILNHDPLCQLVDVNAPFTAQELSYFRMDANLNDPSTTNLLRRFDTMALERAYCRCNSPEPYLYCKNVEYVAKINTMSMPDNQIKNLFFQNLKELYLGNRNMRKQRAFDFAGNTCEPCGACRMDLNGEPVFPSIFKANASGVAESIQNDDEYSNWMNQIIMGSISGNVGNTVPTGLSQELSQINIEQNLYQVDEIMNALVSCGMSQATLNNVRNYLNTIDPANGGNGIKPADVKQALINNNVTLSDLCNPFLVEYGILDKKKYASKGDFVNKNSGFYSGISDFLNRQQVKSAMLAATATGSTNYTINLNLNNLYEKDLATVLGVTLPTQNVRIKSYLVSVNESQGSYYKIVSTYGGITDTLFFANRKLTVPLPGGSGNAIYDQNTSPPFHQESTLSSTFNNIHSVLDDPLVTTLENGKLAPYLVFGNYTKIQQGVIQPFVIYANYVIWSHNIPMLRPKQADAPENCLSCIAINNEVSNYYSEATSYSLPVNANHPLFETALTNYLNYKFGRKHHFEEYERLMKGCALTDHILIPRSDAYIQATFPTQSAANTYLNTTLASAYPAINFSHFKYNLPNGNTVVWFDLNNVPLTSLRAVKQYIMTAPNAIYQPAGAGTVKVFLKQSCPAPAFPNTNVTSQQVAIPNFNNTTTVCTLYSITPNDNSASGVAGLIASVNGYYNNPDNCRAVYITGTSQLYRSKDYTNPIKQDYLNYVYNSLGSISNEEALSRLSPTSLKQNIPSLSSAILKLSYKDEWCNNVMEDLYYYNVPAANEPGWVRLKDIITKVKATLGGNKLFPATNAVTDISLAGSAATLGNSLKAYKMTDGGVWYRLFGPEAELYNVYLYPSERMVTNASAYSAVASTATDPNPMPLQGVDSLYRFSVRMVYNNHYVVCHGYADFPLGAGSKLENVVLYDNQNDYKCIDTMPCEREVMYTAVQQGMLQHKMYLDSVANSHFLAMKQFFPANSTDQLYLTSQQQQYQYTLYYYDLAGNLTRTVPPAGVHPLSGTTQNIANIDIARNSASPASQVTFKPTHTKVSTYKYNSLNQLTWQQTPDGGITEFFYDAAGRLAFSQNAKQRPDHKYSYTLYDEQGRIFETGAIGFDPPAYPEVHPGAIRYSYNNQMNTPGGIVDIVHSKLREDVVATVYDNQLLNLGDMTGLSPQQNLRKRVSAILYAPLVSIGNTIDAYYTYATHFSYDAMGNVSTLVHDNPYLDYMGQRFKRIDYDYDLLSGKVNMLSYNRGLADQIYYKYDYDADNRITTAYSSKEGLEWDRDAAYEYYRHGPLASVHVGDLQVQSVQYAYTIQGWLKAINGDVLNPNEDMGKDGIAPNSDLNLYPKDVMSHALDYYAGDYKPIGTTPVMHTLQGNGITRSLYNGNIARQTTATAGIQSSASLQRNYEYDQLNRIKQATYANMDNISHAVTSLGEAYKNTYAYDPDGNITSLIRKNGSSNVIDNFTYGYYNPNTNNILSYVSDAAGATAAGRDLQPGQTSGNYGYDAIGNLNKDVQEGIKKIDWNLYGKVSHLAKGTAAEDTMNLYFSYDGTGNRVRKDYIHPSETEGIQQRESDIYVRDAAGNILAVYHTSSQLDGASIIEWINDDIINQDGGWITPEGTGFGPFVIDQVGSNDIFVGNLIAYAIELNPEWISQLIDMPLGVYFGNSQLLGMAVAEPFFDDRGYYNKLIKFHDNSILPVALEDNESVGIRPLLEAVWTEKYFERFDVSRAFVALAETLPEITDSLLAKSGFNYDNLTNEEKGNMISSRIRGEPDMLNKYLELFVNSTQQYSPLSYYRWITTDSQFIDAIQYEEKHTIEQYLKKILISSRNQEVVHHLPTFFEEWLGDEWLKKNTTTADRTNVVYRRNRLGFILDLLQHKGLREINKAILATGITGTQYTDWVLNAVINGGTLNPNYEPPQVNTPDPDNLLGENMYLAEHHLYGSSRLGIKHYSPDDYKAVFANNMLDDGASSLNKRQPWYSGRYMDWIKAGKAEEYTAAVYNLSLDTFRQQRWLGRKEYELTDHLGNVLVTFLDRKTGYGNSNGNYQGFNADISSVTDYYPFGAPIQERTLNIATPFSKFGYNGQLRVDEIYGKGNFLDFALRGYDSRIIRFLSIDPLSNKFPYWTPYQFAGNSPIRFKELEGAEIIDPITNWLLVDGMISIVTKPKSAKAKVTGVALGIGGAVENIIQAVRHPIETGKGIVKMATQTPAENAVDYAIGLSEKYGDLPEPVQNYAVGAQVTTDIALTLLPFKKAITKPSALSTSVVPEIETGIGSKTLFRNMGVKEYKSFQSAGGNFTKNPYGTPLYLWEDMDGLNKWNKSGFANKGPNVKIEVNKTALQKLGLSVEKEGGLNGEPSYYVVPEEKLGDFNKTINSVEEIKK